jgi:hypothetical protein
MMEYLGVVNFEKFQHYKTRNPPWIKLYASVLDNYEFGCLQDASKAHLMGIWLLASKTGNKVPADPEWIGKRIQSSEPVDLQPLMEHGFIELSSNTLAVCKQNHHLETEKSREETENNKGAEAPNPFSHLMGVCREVGYTDLAKCGSVLKVLLKRNSPETIERVVRGLRLVIPEAESIKPLHSKEHGDNIWNQAHEAQWNVEKETKPKHTEAELQRLDFSEWEAA